MRNEFAICSAAYWASPYFAGEVDQTTRDARYQGTYTTLQLWETARAAVAISTDTEIATIVGTWAAADGNLTLSGFGNIPQCIIIRAQGLARHDGIYGHKTGAYSITGATAISCSQNLNVIIDGIQIAPSSGVGVDSTGLSTIQVAHCILKKTGTATNAIQTGVVAGSIIIYDCVITGAWTIGVRSYTANAITAVYNCTIETGNTGTALSQTAGTASVSNSVLFNNATDISGTWTANYMAMTTLPSTVTSGVQVIDWKTVFMDWVNGDFRLLPMNPLIGAAIAIPAGQTFTDDIVGSRRLQWDIGAWDYGAPRPPIYSKFALSEYALSFFSDAKPSKSLAGALAGAILTIFSGTQAYRPDIAPPSDATILGYFTFPPYSRSVINMGGIAHLDNLAQTTWIASGKPTWARCATAAPNRTIFDCSVGVAANNPDLVVTLDTVRAGDVASIAAGPQSLISING